MIIILEGPDGSGKTTLANKLADQMGCTIIHRSQPKTEEEKQQMLNEYIKTINSYSNVIYDRCWYSEMAYGPVMRDETIITYPQMYELERLLARRGALLIYCTGPDATLWKRCTSRGEDYVTSKDNFIKICRNYDEIMGVPHIIPVVTYKVPV